MTLRKVDVDFDLGLDCVVDEVKFELEPEPALELELELRLQLELWCPYVDG